MNGNGGYYMSKYDVIIIGAGPGGIFAAYELAEKAPELKVAVFEAGNPLEKRKCPIDGKNQKLCKLQDLCNHEWIRRSRCIF